MIRYIKTGIPFFIFGFICFLGLIIFMLFYILGLTRFKSIQSFSRYLVMMAWRTYTNILRYFFPLTLNKIQADLSGNSNVIIANHPSILDVVFLLAYFPKSNCVVKQGIKKNPLLYPAVLACGYIINTMDAEFLEKCDKALKNGENLIIFPEGTRTDDKIIMHKGASYIGIHGGKKIVQFYISMKPKFLGKHDKWYDLPKKIDYYIIRLDDIDIENFYTDKPDPVRVKKLHEFISKEYAELEEKDRIGELKYGK